MNGVLFEIFSKSFSIYVESPSVNLGTLCMEIAVGLKTKLLRDVVPNNYKHEIIDILEKVANENCIRDFVFNLDRYDLTLISNFNICNRTRYVLNYLLFSNFTSNKIPEMLATNRLVSLSGFYYLFFMKHYEC